MKVSDIPMPTFKALKAYGQTQSDYFNEFGTCKGGNVYFEFNGTDIYDPFTSECGRFEVDPIKTYGEHNFLLWAFSATAEIFQNVERLLGDTL